MPLGAELGAITLDQPLQVADRHRDSHEIGGVVAPALAHAHRGRDEDIQVDRLERQTALAHALNSLHETGLILLQEAGEEVLELGLARLHDHSGKGGRIVSHEAWNHDSFERPRQARQALSRIHHGQRR
jgi:hypothetical protein